MRLHYILVLLSSLAACSSEHVPGVCCVTPAQCDHIGLDETRPCEVGQACKDNLCVAAECTGAADCTDPNLPVCSLGFCVAGCQVADDCAGVAGKPICAADGMCVGCETSAQCPADHAICDATDRQCRGCERDDECAGGVCLEADNVCVADAEVIFADSSGTDAGNCTRAAPCATLEFALTKVPGRSVIHALSSTLVGSSSSNIVEIPRSVYIDGVRTSIVDNLDITGPDVTVGRMDLGGTTTVRTTQPAGASARLFDVTSLKSVSAMNAALVAIRSSLGAIVGTAGTISVLDSSAGSVDTTNTQLAIKRSTLTSTNDALGVMGGQLVLENSVLIGTDAFADLVSVHGVASGSTIRFNTFFNTTQLTGSGAALCFDSTVAVTSNIFAFLSTHPLARGVRVECTGTATFSLFDNVALAPDTAGEGNKVADRATFFTDPVTLDLTLSSQSPAKMASQPGLDINEDNKRAHRPQPAGTLPDVGAFEAP